MGGFTGRAFVITHILSRRIQTKLRWLQVAGLYGCAVPGLHSPHSLYRHSFLICSVWNYWSKPMYSGCQVKIQLWGKITTPGGYWKIFLAEKLFFQNSFDCYVQHNPEFLIYAYLPSSKGVRQLYVVDSIPFQAHCLLTLSCAICSLHRFVSDFLKAPNLASIR